MRTIRHIVLHCTASTQDATVEDIQSYWRRNLGWKSPGYHFLIEANGVVHNLQPIELPSNGVAGHNANSIHISYIGGVNGKKAVDNRTPKQIETMIRLVREMKSKFPKAMILGHRDFKGVNKACPSFDVAQWLKSVGL